MMVDKALYKSMYDDFVRSIVCRNGKFIIRVTICSRKDKTLSSPWRKQYNVVSMLLGQGLVTQGTVLYLGSLLVSAVGRYGTQ